jgi:hypothetical protein
MRMPRMFCRKALLRYLKNRTVWVQRCLRRLDKKDHGNTALRIQAPLPPGEFYDSIPETEASQSEDIATNIEVNELIRIIQELT